MKKQFQSAKKAVAGWLRGAMGASGVDAIDYSYSRNRAWRPTIAMDSREQYSEGTRTKALSLARQAYINDGNAQAIVRTISQNAIGTGINPQAQTTNDGWNTEAEQVWKERTRGIDAGGRLSLEQLCALASEAIDVDGDIFVLLASENGAEKIKLVEAHKVGNGSSKAPDGMVDGVMLDRMGAPSKFRVLAGQTFQDFEAKDVIPLYDPRRCDQHRGLTGFIHALNDIQDRGEIIALEKTGVKVSLTPSLVLYSDSGDDLLSSSQVTSDDQVYEQFQAGQIVKRSATDKLESFQSNRPTTGLKDFDDLLLRKICAGHGIPFEFIFSPTALSGPAARLVMAQASRTFERRQKLIIDKLLQRLWGWIISRAILRGDLAPMPFLEAQRVRWQGPSKISIDVGRDAKANLDDLRAGLRTWAEDYSERGQDWQEALKQKAREAAYIKQLAEEYGVTVDQIAMLTPNPIQPILPA